MASPAVKHMCATCGKSAGIFTCSGCSQVFCTRHVNEHRQLLGKQMNEVVFEHDQLRRTLIEQKTKNPMTKEIDEWEQQTIAKVHRMADDARRQLMHITEQRRKHIETVLQKLTDQLNRARNEDDFIETDLKQWSKRINELKRDLAEPLKISMQSKNDDINGSIVQLQSFLRKTHSFEQLNDDTRTEDNQQSTMKRKLPLFYLTTQSMEASSEHPRVIELLKTQGNFGFRVTGGREQTSPIYISHIIPNGVAWKHGGLRNGDQLLSINGVSVENEYHEKAVELLKKAQGIVKLVVRYSPE